MNSHEARVLGNPYSFLHVSKPEIDLEPGIDVYSESVYAKGAENFRLLQEQGALVQDTQPGYYLYRQIMDGHARLVWWQQRVVQSTMRILSRNMS